MRKFRLLILLAVGLILLFALIFKNINRNTSPLPNLSLQSKPLKIRVSIPYWDQEQATKSFKEHSASVNEIALYWYYLSDTGQIQKYEYAKEDLELISFAHQQGIKVNLLISNLPEQGSWDAGRVERVISSKDRRSQHISDIATKLKSLDADAVTIDYEQLNGRQKANFSQFIKELKQALFSQGKFVGVALHPKNGSKSDAAYSFQDWTELSRWADELYIMAFGEHWDESHSGSVASIPWVTKIVNYVQRLKLPKEKIYLIAPLYGYDWIEESDNKATGLTFTDVGKLIKKYQVTLSWDEKAKSPFLQYQNEEKHTVWFENAASVSEKIKLAKQAGLGGVSFWRLGGEDPLFWSKLKQ